MGASHSAAVAVAPASSSFLATSSSFLIQGSSRATGAGPSPTCTPGKHDGFPLELRNDPAFAVATSAVLNATAVIDPSHATTGSAASATSSAPVISPTGPAHFLFVWGDSYTETGFNISGTKPSALNPLGNPGYPGHTNEVGMQNWVDLLTVNAGVQALTYNFADGGAAINNSLTDGSNANVPAFVDTSNIFFADLAPTPRPNYAEWTADNSVFIIWYGRNDIYWRIINDEPQSRLDDAMNSLELIMTRLVDAGAQRFVLLGVPPFWREPLWQEELFTKYAAAIHPDVAYWNSNLQTRLKSWKAFYPNVKLSWLDTTDTFDQVLDHPGEYGAPNVYCKNDSGDPPSNGTNCLWADIVHPGPVLNQHIATLVGEQLQDEGFFPHYVANGGAADSGSSQNAAPAANAASFVMPTGMSLLISFVTLTGYISSAWP